MSQSDTTGNRFAQIAASLESRLLKRLPAAVTVTDDQGVIVYWNDRAESMYGYPRRAVLGRPAEALAISGAVSEAQRARVRELLMRERWAGELDVRHADGSLRPVFATMEAVSVDEIGFRGVAVTAVDISQQRKLEADVAYRSLHDPLTGLPDRQLFLEHVDSALERRIRSGGSVALLVLDLDNFKVVNDECGHEVGDTILETVAAYLTGLAQPGDVVARVGGDEFAVCSDVRSLHEGMLVAERILQVLRAPFLAGGREFTVAASIGIAVSAMHTHGDALIRDAQSAMYRAKDAGRGRIEIFDDEAHALARARREVSVALDRGIADGQLEVFFQPEVAVATGVLSGFEALVRWRHPERGLLLPLEFIEAAEESGLIGLLGEKVLDAACAQLAEWQALSPEAHLTVAVNVSGRQLADPDFPETVRRIIGTHEVPAARVCLEVTEGALDQQSTDTTLRRLKALGLLLAVDDFGTGYSSLSRLKRFPVDFLKIDRSFVSGIGTDPEDEVIVASVVNLAHSLGLEVIAEGVERIDQLELLASLGCDHGQGYLWERPLDAEQATAHVRSGRIGAHVARTAGHQPNEEDALPIDARAAVSILVHELAGPITVLAGYAELLVTAEDPATRATAGAAVDRSSRLARSALSWATDIADLDHEGTLRLDRRKVSLADVVADAVLLAEAKGAARTTFQVDVADDVMFIDRERVTGAVANLLVNAKKFSPDGGIVVVRSEWTAGRCVVLHVLDDGPGVPAEHVGLIFRKFGRADRVHSGSGLGLFMARGVARAHGGEATYRRRAEGGSDFMLELPGG